MPPQSVRLYIDLDDTLIGVLLNGEVVPVAHAYDEVLQEFADRMVGWGYPREEVLKVQVQQDLWQCGYHGFGSANRFANSLALTYQAFTVPEKKSRPNNLKSIRKLGMKVFEFPARPLPGALEALHTLNAAFEIVIVTKGSKHQQYQKIAEADIRVGKTVVMDKKSPEEWKQFLRWELFVNDGAMNCVAIGNSMWPDVITPMLCGVNRGICLSDMAKTWEYEASVNAAGIPQELEDRVVTVRSFADVPSVLL